MKVIPLKKLKGLLPKSSISTNLNKIWNDACYLCAEHNYYFNFGEYIDRRSCCAKLILNKLLSDNLNHYTDDVRYSDNWNSIVNKTKLSLIKKYFSTGVSGRMTDISEWLKPGHKILMDFPIMSVRPKVIVTRNIDKDGREIIKRFMFVPKEITEAVEYVKALLASQKKKFKEEKRDKFISTPYYFPRFKPLEVLNRDVYCQPEYIKRIIFKE